MTEIRNLKLDGFERVSFPVTPANPGSAFGAGAGVMVDLKLLDAGVRLNDGPRRFRTLY